VDPSPQVRSLASETIAEKLAEKQREISVAEFFERNKQILGFDSPTRALLHATKEAVDNALDACEEASILPDIQVEFKQGASENEFLMIVEDNGPGIVRKNLGNVFGSLLFGSRFHSVRQSRGQQGIGISATVLYGQLTTGKHTIVTSKIGKGHPAVKVELAIDTKRNAPEKIKEETVTWEKEHGTRVEIPLVGRYIKGKQSPFEYLRATAIVNPHARLSFVEPDGTTTVFERVHDEVPPPAKEIKPHPLGTEIGALLRMARAYEGYKLSAFLTSEFSSVGARTAADILKTSDLKDTVHPKKMTRDQAKALVDAFPKVKIMAPPTDCLSPIGEVLVKRGLKKETIDVSPEFIVSTSRPASVQSGHPFVIEAGIVYGGTLNKEEPVKVLRYANRVPLLYQQGACALTHAIEDMDWRRYGFDQRGGKGVPVGPAIVLVHIAATKVPFTSESKEAVADMEEILKEVKLGLQECARTLGRHLAKRTKREKTREKFTLITKILPKIAEKSSHIVGKPAPKLDKVLCEIMNVVWIDDVVEGEKMATPKPPPAAKPAPKTAAGATRLSDFSAEELAALNSTNVPKLHVERFNAMSKITIWNYMLKKQHFKLFAVIPPHAVVAETSVKPKTVKDRYLEFEIPAIAPAQSFELSFTLAGLEKGDYDENELYVGGINEVYVVGADPWRGAEGVLQQEETAAQAEA
jgi:DNA topoisomerase VI subunit B